MIERNGGSEDKQKFGEIKKEIFYFLKNGKYIFSLVVLFFFKIILKEKKK